MLPLSREKVSQFLHKEIQDDNKYCVEFFICEQCQLMIVRVRINDC